MKSLLMPDMDPCRKALSLPEGRFILLFTGSRAEGVTMEQGLGYDPPDFDVMFVYSDGWAVHLPHRADWRYMAWQEPDRSKGDNFAHLQLCEEGCSAGYYKVKVNGSPQKLMDRMAKAVNYIDFDDIVPTETLGSDRAANCFLERDGTVWLSSTKTVETFRQFLSSAEQDMSGPASHLDGGRTEIIVTLMCLGPLPATLDFHSRPRQSEWPPKELMDRMQITPGMLVCATDKLSSGDEQALQFRMSYSAQELLLVKDMPAWVRQGYTAFKLTVKSLLTRRRHCEVSEGRKKVCSYHLKTVLFWTLEDPATWDTHCPFQLIMVLLANLRAFISKSPPVLPNYFIPECNLFAHTDILDVELLLQVVTQIQSDPFKCILDAPISPGLLYGVGPVIRDPYDWDELASSYRDLLKEGLGATKEELQECLHMLERSHPRRRPFRWLMAGCLFYRVEKYREWLWEVSRRRDSDQEKEVSRVHHRPRPRRLMEIWRGLKEHVPYWILRCNREMSSALSTVCLSLTYVLVAHRLIHVK